ncbi:MAG: DUF262 domain-containing protein [Bacilli bacterium]|nr:DUF262 domain-containing protein [Bacilli bacterium]
MQDDQYKPFAWSLKDAIGQQQFIVPVYQRPYSWEKKEVDALLDDIFNAYHEHEAQDILFTGTLFLRKAGMDKSGIYNRYEVVDGQQRLTTFSMLLLSVYSLCCQRGLSKRRNVEDIQSGLWKYYSQKDACDPQERLIELGSIDRKIFIEIFDAAYRSPAKIKTFVEKYDPKNSIEENIRKQFLNIYNRVEAEIPPGGKRPEKIADFGSFLFQHILFICIQASVPMPRVFSVFESINSKGRSLDTVDLIKTYIFSVLEEADYDTYLARWGKLIEITNDNLEEYIRTYIRAYISYYRQSISLSEFKSLSRRDKFLARFHTNDVKEGLKAFIDDLLEKAPTYRLLSNEQETCKLVGKDEFRLFYKIFSINHYQHPKPLLFRALQEFKDGSLSKDDVSKITRAATLFIFLFLSINGGDSKDCIDTFERACKMHYDKALLNAKSLGELFKKDLIAKGVNVALLETKLMATDFYSKHDLAYTILSLYESVSKDKNRLLFEQACFMLDHIKDNYFHEDHLLPKTPNSSDKRLKYSKVHTIEENKEIVALHPGHDFPPEAVGGMDYSEFCDRFLGLVGNIRLYLKRENEARGNEVTKLPEHEDFVRFEQIRERCKDIAQTVFTCPDLMK